jgi:predicted transcriptional regulator
MTQAKRNIEVDEATAATLESRAAERGLSVSDLIAEMTATHGPDRVFPREEIAELDRQWMAIKSGEATVPHEKVVRWLQTWGTPSFRPWNDR